MVSVRPKATRWLPRLGAAFGQLTVVTVSGKSNHVVTFAHEQRLGHQECGCGAERAPQEGAAGDQAGVPQGGAVDAGGPVSNVGRSVCRNERDQAAAVRTGRTSYPRGNGNRPAGPQGGASGRHMTELSRTATPTFPWLLSLREGSGAPEDRPGSSFLTPTGGPVSLRATASSGAAPTFHEIRRSV